MKNWIAGKRWLRHLAVVAAVLLLALTVSTFTAGSVAAQEPATAETTARLNLRAGPGLEYEILEVLDLGTEVEFTGRRDLSGEWLEVETLAGNTGWVAGQFLSVTPTLDSLEVWLAEGEEPAEAAEAVDAATDAAEMVTEGEFSPAVVTAETLVNLNIRDAPGLDAQLLDTLPAGTTVGFTGFMDETGEWVQVDAFGYPVGWVAAEFLSNVPGGLQVAPELADDAGEMDEETSGEEEMAEEDPAEEDPAEEDPAEEDPAGSGAITATTTANLNLRDNPNLEAQILTTLPAGTEVTFTGFMDETGEWVQVEVDGQAGWVAAEFLSNVPADLQVWEGETESDT